MLQEMEIERQRERERAERWVENEEKRKIKTKDTKMRTICNNKIWITVSHEWLLSQSRRSET